MTTQAQTKWHLKGTVVLACNCDYGCPCNFNARPTQGYCEGGWSWNIEQGEYGATRLNGLNISLFVRWPKAIHEGNGEAIVLIDQQASSAQREALGTLLSGKAGGPWGILANTITKRHASQFVPFELKLDGVRSVLRAGKILELEMEPIRNPVTKAEAYPKVVLPQGFIWKDGDMASSKKFSVQGGIKYEYPGKYAAISPFEYTVP